MSNRVCIGLILAAFLLMTRTPCAGKEETASPETLSSRALLQEEIRAQGMPPVLMRAEIQVLDVKGAWVQGSYTLNWVSPSRWREELRVGSYERLRIGDAKGFWQRSGLDYQPEIAFRLDTVLHVKDVLRPGSKQFFGKVKSQKDDGVWQECAEVRSAHGVDRVLCFDDASGALLSVEYHADPSRIPPQISRIEYYSFRNVSEKLVPFGIRALRGEKPIVTMKVLEITRVSEESPALFEAPSNAEFWTRCDDMKDPELVGKVQPTYPASARESGEQGRVMLYAVVEVDGSLSHITVIQRATPSLESAAVEAVHGWHYEPALCGQSPIRLEIPIIVDFWLRY